MSVAPDGDAIDDDLEIEIRSFRQGPKGAVPVRHYLSATTVTEAARLLLEDCDRRQFDAYMGVHLRRRGVGQGGNASVQVLTAMFADVDCDKHGVTKEAALDLAMHAPFGPPTLVVDSGGGLHTYWVYRERVDIDDDAYGEHRRAVAWLRAWFSESLAPKADKPVADEMSTKDRILRAPSTANWKPIRRLPDGSPPPTSLLVCEPGRLVDLQQILEFIPAGFNADAFAAAPKSSSAFDPDDLPTEIPQRLRRVMAAARIAGYRSMDQHGRIQSIKLRRCPACNSDDGGCYLTPLTGTLRTWHQQRCPAARKFTGGAVGTNGRGLALHEWVPRFAPRAAAVLTQPESVPRRQIEKADRLALVFSSFEAAQDFDDEDRLATSLAGRSPAAVVGAQIGEAVWVSERCLDGDRLAAAVLASSRNGGGLLPLRDAEGAIRSGVWLADGAVLPIRLTGSVADERIAGGVLVLGSLPQAAARAGDGDDLFIALGVVDYLALVGLGETEGLEGVSLGVPDPRHLPRVLRHLSDAWARTRQIPRRVVVLGSHGGDRSALDVLDGVAGVVWLDLAHGSLDDALQASTGTAPVLRQLRSARLDIDPPIRIEDAPGKLMQDLRKAALLACSMTTHGRRTLVVYTPPAGSGKSTAAQKLADEMVDGRFPIPIQGKRPRGYPKHLWPPQERAIAFATPTHKLADDKHEDHETLGLKSERERFKGALESCAFAEEVEDWYADVGRVGICGLPETEQRCERASFCPGAQAPKPRRGVLAYTTDAMLRNLRFDFAFMDESTGVVEAELIDRERFATLYAGKLHPRVRKWRTVSNPEAVQAAQMLAEIVDPLARQHGADVGAGRVDPFARRITGDELCRVIEVKPGLADLIDFGYGPGAVAPPRPLPAELRSGSHSGRHMPNLRAFRVMRALRDFYRRTRGLDRNPNALPILNDSAPDSPPPIVVLQLNEDGTWGLEERAVKALPDCPVVMLDATGRMTLAEYEAAYPQFRVHMMQLRVHGAPPKKAIHVRTRSVGRGSLFTATGEMKQHASRLVRKLILHLASETRAAYPRHENAGELSLGVLTYNRVYDGLIGNKRTMADDQLAACVRELAQRGIHLKIGYFGVHDRGTNEFENVDGLLVLGDARQNLGTVEADCELLRLRPADVMAGRAKAVLVQAVFRARHTRRQEGHEAVVMLACAEAPDIPGLAWSEVDVSPGAASDARSIAAELIAFVGAEHEVVGARAITLEEYTGLGLPKNPASLTNRHAVDDAIREFLVERPSWRPYAVSPTGAGRPFTVWAASDEAAVRWAVGMLAAKRVCRQGSDRNLVPQASESEFVNDYANLPDSGFDAPESGAGLAPNARNSSTISEFCGDALQDRVMRARTRVDEPAEAAGIVEDPAVGGDDGWEDCPGVRRSRPHEGGGTGAGGGP